MLITNIYIAALIVMVLWGLQPILQKHLVKQLPHKMVMLLTGTAYFTSLVIFCLYYSKELKPISKDVKLKHILTAVVSAGICSFLGNIIFYQLLSSHDAHFVTAFTSSFPILTLFFAYIILKENITMESGVGIIFVSIGLWLIAIGKNKK